MPISSENRRVLALLLSHLSPGINSDFELLKHATLHKFLLEAPANVSFNIDGNQAQLIQLSYRVNTEYQNSVELLKKSEFEVTYLDAAGEKQKNIFLFNVKAISLPEQIQVCAMLVDKQWAVTRTDRTQSRESQGLSSSTWNTRSVASLYDSTNVFKPSEGKARAITLRDLYMQNIYPMLQNALTILFTLDQLQQRDTVELFSFGCGDGCDLLFALKAIKEQTTKSVTRVVGLDINTMNIDHTVMRMVDCKKQGIMDRRALSKIEQYDIFSPQFANKFSQLTPTNDAEPVPMRMAIFSGVLAEQVCPNTTTALRTIQILRSAMDGIVVTGMSPSLLNHRMIKSSGWQQIEMQTNQCLLSSLGAPPLPGIEMPQILTPMPAEEYFQWRKKQCDKRSERVSTLDFSLSSSPLLELKQFQAIHTGYCEQATLLDISFAFFPENAAVLVDLITWVREHLPNVNTILLSPEQKWNHNLQHMHQEIKFRIRQDANGSGELPLLFRTGLRRRRDCAQKDRNQSEECSIMNKMLMAKSL